MNGSIFDERLVAEISIMVYNGLVQTTALAIAKAGRLSPKSCNFSAFSLQNCNFLKEIVRKLKFPNNSSISGKGVYHEVDISWTAGIG